MNGHIDNLLEEIDSGLVTILHQIVLAHHEGEVNPFAGNFALEFGLFTLPNIRRFAAQSTVDSR